MEKVLYVVAGPTGLGSSARRQDLAARLEDLGAHGVQINVADEDVAAAAPLRMAAEATTDPIVFFDAVDDDDRLARHQQQMFESVQRFIDLSALDVIPTSRYPMSPRRP